MNKKYILGCLVLIMAMQASAQISFFKGSLQEALVKAKQENKKVFVDFYADWCGPCKAMASQVFTREEVGVYFNEHFVCCQLDVEAKEVADVVKQYKITSLPTLAFMDDTGKEIRRIEGAVAADVLMNEAKSMTGEALSFEQMYEKYKKSKRDTDLAQQLLLEAPRFIGTQKGYEQTKWRSRIEVLFPEYMKNKKLESMINQPDFMILTLYHSKAEKEDPIFDFMLQHYDEYADCVGEKDISSYLVGLNNAYIIQLCKAGNTSYKKRLDRLDGDMQKLYGMFKFGDLSVKEAITCLADATYYLHRHDEKAYVENMDKYFTGAEENLSVDDYTQALEEVHIVYGKSMTERLQLKCIDWATRALKKDMEAMVRVRLLLVTAECYAGTGKTDEAKQCLNQAFLKSAEIDDPDMMLKMQMMIKNRLQKL